MQYIAHGLFGSIDDGVNSTWWTNPDHWRAGAYPERILIGDHSAAGKWERFTWWPAVWALTSLLAAPYLHFMCMIAQSLAVIAHKWVVMGKIKAQHPYTIMGSFMARWIFIFRMTTSLDGLWLWAFDESEITSILYRLMGAKVGKNVRIGHIGAPDFDVLTCVVRLMPFLPHSLHSHPLPLRVRVRLRGCSHKYTHYFHLPSSIPCQCAVRTYVVSYRIAQIRGWSAHRPERCAVLP